MGIKISDFGLLTFDCYGTLIDWERGLGSVLQGWAARRGRDFDREELLAAFAEIEPQAEREMPTSPYRDVLRRVQALLGERFSLPADPADAEQLAESVGDWPPFRDSAEALRRLGERYRLVIVSNVDRYSFAKSQQLLRTSFDAVVTAEDVGAYKPDLRMFERAISVAAGFGVRKEGILHVAQSLYHDHVPAHEVGLGTVWVDRRRGRAGGATPAPGTEVEPHLVVGSLMELVELDDRQRAGE